MRLTDYLNESDETALTQVRLTALDALFGVYAHCYRVATIAQRKSPRDGPRMAHFTLKCLVAEGGFEPPTKGL